MLPRKGVLLAGGAGSRMRPATLAVNKHLFPLYDRPIIYYPLGTLIRAGVTDVCVVIRGEDREAFSKLLGDGAKFGIRISYADQCSAEGIVDAMLSARSFVGNDPFYLVLGDNIFCSFYFDQAFRSTIEDEDASGAKVFAVEVDDISALGAIDFDESGLPLRLIEKSSKAVKGWALIGIYIYDSRVMTMAASVSRSARGEFEITDLNSLYLESRQLKVVTCPAEGWFDVGTPRGLLDAANYLRYCGETKRMRFADIEQAKS